MYIHILALIAFTLLVSFIDFTLYKSGTLDKLNRVVKCERGV